MNSKSVLLVDDDLIFARLLFFQLQRAGYHCIIESNADTVLALLKSKVHPDLFIVDVELGQTLNGIELTRIIKQRSNKPVIIVSGKDSEDTIVSGLDGGADQYLVKPYRRNELLAHVRNILKKTRSDVANPQQGAMTIDSVNRVLYWADKRASITEKEASIIRILLEHEGKELNRESLFVAVYGSRQRIQSRCIDALISRARKKINATGAPYCINYVRSFGYMLCRAHAEKVRIEPSTSKPELQAQAKPDVRRNVRAGTHTRKRR